MLLATAAPASGEGTPADGWLRAQEGKELVRVDEPLPEDPSAAGLEPLPAEAAPGRAEEEVAATVRRWSQAWERQQADEFLAFYSPQLKLPEDVDRRRWEQQLRERLAAPSFIRIRLEQPQLTLLEDGRYRVEVMLRCRTELREEAIFKILHLERREEGWKIQRERSELLSFTVLPQPMEP